MSLRLPWLFFALPAGALADRLDRRRTMTLVNGARAVLIGLVALTVATGAESLPLLCAVAFALGIGETLFDTAAQSIVPRLVGPDELPRANSRIFAVEISLNQFVGPPLGGFVVGVSAAAALAGSAGAYVLAAGVLTLVAGSFRSAREGPPTRLREDIVEGVRYLATHRLLRTLAILTGVVNLAGGATMTVLPLYAVGQGSELGLSEAGYGLLLTTAAIGVVVGSIATPALLRRLGRARTMLLSIVVFSLPLGVPGVTDTVLAIGILMGLGGVVAAAWNVVTVSLRQRLAPDALLGRVNAGYRLVAWGALPLGAGLAGVLGEAFGIRAVFYLSAATVAAAIPLALLVVTERNLVAA